MNWRLDPTRTGLLVIDVQEKLVPVMHGAERLVNRLLTAVAVARQFGLPVFHTEQAPEKLGATIAPVRAALGLCGVLMLCGFQVFGQPDGAVEDPEHPDDSRWTQFSGVKITVDKAHGVMRADFPADLRRQEGRPVNIGGYMTPLQPSVMVDHFILTRRSSGCPFCPPNEATEALEVFTTRKVRFERKQWLVHGRLKLVGDSGQGLFFQLTEATAS